VVGAIQRSGATTGVFVFLGCKSFPFILLKLTLDSPVSGRDIFCLNQNLRNLRIFRMKSEPRFSGFLDDPDFAFNQGNLVNPANPGSDILIQTSRQDV